MRRGIAMDGDEQDAAGDQDAVEFGEPGVLQRFIEVREHGVAVDDVEMPGRISQGRIRWVGDEAARGEIHLAPSDGVRIDVGSVELGGSVVFEEPANCPAAAATEVEHAASGRNINPEVTQLKLDVPRASFANVEKVGCGDLLGDAKSEGGWRQRDAVTPSRKAIGEPERNSQVTSIQRVISATDRRDQGLRDGALQTGGERHAYGIS